jgi:hypothetical protein
MVLEGLDRLYFDRVRVAALPPAVAARVPSQWSRLHAIEDADDERALTVRDFPLPRVGAHGNLVLRQVVESSHPRINDLWLVLYDGGRRSDVWHFRAYPNPDGKLLPNYRIESVQPATGGGVTISLRGAMIRPQGAWWVTGKVVTLVPVDGALRFAHVRNAFGFRHEYDHSEEAEAPTDVRIEREIDGRFEERDIEPAPPDVMKACGLEPAEAVTGTWETLESLARCVTQAPRATVTSRDPAEPSFAERGFKRAE